MGKTTKAQEITLKDLAALIKKGSDEVCDLVIMVKAGFDGVDAQFKSVDEQFKGVAAQFKGVDEQFKGVNKLLDKLDKNVYENSCDIKALKIGQEKHTKEISELKDVVQGVFRIEMIDLKKRVTKIEEKLGITY